MRANNNQLASLMSGFIVLALALTVLQDFSALRQTNKQSTTP